MNIYIEYNDETVRYQEGYVARFVDRSLGRSRGRSPLAEDIERNFLDRFSDCNGKRIVVYSRDLIEFVSGRLALKSKDLVQQFNESVRDLA